MRPRVLISTCLIASSPAYAEAPPTRVADLDAELMRYVAEAEARATANPETIEVDDATSPVDTPSAGVRVVGARALELTPHKNADDLLRVVPGLYTSQHGAEGKGQQFFLRGFDAVHGADLAIRVAGIPINEASNVHGQGYADLGFVIPETVGGITARKGPFDLEQGFFATAGSVDLALAIPNARGRRVGYELGSTNRHRLVAVDAPVGGPAAELVAIDVMHDDGFGEDRGSEHGSAIGQTEITAGAVTLRPLVVGYWSRFGEPGVIALDDISAGRFDRMAAPAGDLGGRSQRLLAGVGATWQRGANEVVASTHLGWRGLAIDENFTGFLENAELGDARSQEHRAITGGGRVAWRHRVSSNVRLLAGTEVMRDAIRQHEDRVSTAGEVWRAERALTAMTTSAGLWAGAEAKLGNFTATGGARLDAMQVTARDGLDPERSGAGKVGAVSPRLAIAWRTERGSLSVAAGRGQRPPEARAFTRRSSREGLDTVVYDGGDAALTAADAVEAGGELKLSRVTFGATGFATWIDRESVFDHLSGTSAQIDGSRRLGTEVFVEASPVSWLALRGDVTAVDARFEVTGNPVPGAPRLLATAEARVELQPFSAGLAGRYLGSRPLAHGATAASSTVVDAVGNYTLGRWSFQVQVDNLLGTQWNEGEYNFASHWDVSAPKSELPRVHISPGRPFGVRAGATVEF